jgi:uncharacterized Zn finger protein (UPF0148 family)
MEDFSKSAGTLTCPMCEAGQLHMLGRDSCRCDYCGRLLSSIALRTLQEINTLPNANGHHACECGHPEMRRLPDGVYWCPACGLEVLPIESPPSPWKFGAHSEDYWSGWMDGRFKEAESFAHNPILAKLASPTERLDYYRGHRAGLEARLARVSQAGLLKAS